MGRPITWFLVALAVRLGYLLFDASKTPLFWMPLLDEEEVVETARGLLRGDGFGPEPLFRAPGYPVFVAFCMVVFGDGWAWGVRLLQALMGAGAAAAVSAAAMRLTPLPGHRAAACAIGGALIAFYGPLVRLEATLSLDAPAAALFAGMVYCLVTAARVSGAGPRRARVGRQGQTKTSVWERWQGLQTRKALLLAGMVGAAMLLLRPTVLPVLVVSTGAAMLAFWFLGHRDGGKHLRHAGLFLGPAILALMLLFVRNGLASGEWRAMPWQGGYNLKEANRLDGPSGRYLRQQEAPAKYPDSPPWRDHALGKALRDRPSANPTREIAIAEFAADQHRRNIPPPARAPFSAVDAWHSAQLRKSLFENPGAHLRLYLLKLLELGTTREVFNYEDFNVQWSRSTYLRLLPIYFATVLMLGLMGLGALAAAAVSTRGADRTIPDVAIVRGLAPWVVAGALAALFAVFTALGYTSGRMRMPLAMPLAAMAGGFPAMAALALRAGGAAARIRTLALTAIFGLIGGVMAYQDFTGVRSEKTAHFDLARMSNAAWHYANELESRSGLTGVTIPLKPLFEQALALANEAEAAAPGRFPTVLRLKAQAHTSLGNVSEAADAWKAVIGAFPNDRSARVNLGVTLLDAPDALAAATAQFAEALSLGAEEARPWLAIAQIRGNNFAAARQTLAPAEKALAPLMAKARPQSAARPPALSIPLRIAIARALLCLAEDQVSAAENLASYFGPRARRELISQAQSARLTVPPTLQSDRTP